MVDAGEVRGRVVLDASGIKKGAEEAKSAFRTVQQAADSANKMGARGAMEHLQALGKLRQEAGSIGDAYKGGLGSLANIASSGAGKLALVGTAAAAVTGAITLAGKAVAEFASQGGRVSNVERAFDRLSKAAGQSSQEILSQTKSASAGLISDFDVMANANKAFLLGLPVTAQEMGTLSRTAITLGQAMNVGPTQALGDLITGLGRGSAAILDNLGITLKAEDAYKRYAESVKKPVDSLTAQEQKLAVYQAALGAASKKVDELGGFQITAAEKTEQLSTAWGNFTDNLKKTVSQSAIVQGSLSGLTKAVEGLDAALRKTDGAWEEMKAGAKDIWGAFTGEVSGIVSAMAKAGPFGAPFVAAYGNYPGGPGMGDGVGAPTPLLPKKTGLEGVQAEDVKRFNDMLREARGEITLLGTRGESEYEQLATKIDLSNQKLIDQAKALGVTGAALASYTALLARAKQLQLVDIIGTSPLASKLDFSGLNNAGAPNRYQLAAPDIIGRSSLGRNVDFGALLGTRGTPNPVTAAATKAAETWDQQLQRLAHTMQALGPLTGGFVGKLSGMLGGIASIGANLKTLGVGGEGGGAFSKLLGKAGAVGGIVAAGVGIFSSLFGGGARKREEERKRREEAEQKAVSTLEQLQQRWESFRSETLSKGVSGLTDIFKALADRTDLSAERLARLGVIGSAVFGSLIAGGGSFVDAAEQFRAAGGAAAQLGVGIDSGRGVDLAGFSQRIQDNEALVRGAEGISSALDAVRVTGGLTQGTFDALQGEVLAFKTDLEAAGFSGQESLAVLARSLFAIQEEAKKGRVQVDATTQGLIDQASTSGLFDGLKDPMAEMVEIQGLMLETTAALATAFGAVLPQSVQKYIDALNKIPSGVPGPPGGLPGGSGDADGGVTPGTPHPTSIDPDFTSAKGYGPRRLTRDTIFQAHAGEHVLIVPAGKKVGFKSARAGFGDDFTPLTREERRLAAGSVTAGDGSSSGGESTAPTEAVVSALSATQAQISELSSQISQLVEQLPALIESSSGETVVVNNNPTIQVRDESLVKTREGVEAFEQRTIAVMDRALRINANGLASRVEAIARRAKA